jgi:monooxygenase
MEDVDVLIVGAGISGIGTGCFLTTRLPGHSFAILEGRDAIGGTWDLFRFPGIRSDSDLFTFGFGFKPWTSDRSIAQADLILDYLRETVREHDLERHVRFGHRVVAARWSSEDARWTVSAEHAGEQVAFRCRFLVSGTGYYDYTQGYAPDFAGIEDFTGTIVHPQFWPEDLDYAGKRVVVIGSGATAATVVPAMAGIAAHVTMLQRTPSYMLSLPAEDPIHKAMKRVLGEERTYPITRRRYIWVQRAVYRASRRYPRLVRRALLADARRHLPKGFDVGAHFNPPYDPWDQRLCAVPDGDLFRAIRDGGAEVVTDRIVTFDETGVRLASGRHLDADVIVTATGLNVQAFGGISITVDGEPVVLGETIAYKGMMLSGVPNLAYAIGYTNSSWTLKVGLLCEHFCRLLAYMAEHGHDTCRPAPADPHMPTRPLLDFAAGYIQRAVPLLPRQGDRMPWLTSMDYATDVKLLRADSVVDPELHFSSSAVAAEVAA